MNTPDPEGMSMLAKVIGAGAAVAVPIWGFFKLWDKKVDKHAYKTDQQVIASKFEVHRKGIAKIFDVLRAQEETAEERHRELLMHLLEKKGE